MVLSPNASPFDEEDYFLRQLVRAVPALSETLTNHLELHGEMLSRLFMADIARWAVFAANTSEGKADDLSKALQIMDVGWIEGGHNVHEMIADSFLENLEMSGPLWELLPIDLRTAAQTMHDTQPDWNRLGGWTKPPIPRYERLDRDQFGEAH